MTSLTDPTDPTDAAGAGYTPPLEAPAPPDVAGLVNLRDVGGMSTADGRRTRPGVLYRSEMPKVGDRPPPESMVWPPRTVIDLRSAVERGPDPHPLAALGAEIRVFPLLGDDAAPGRHTTASGAMEAGLQALYVAMVEHAAPQLAAIVDVVATAPGPVLVHCAAGKDRTGVTISVLLRLAGVVERDVLADYAATEQNMRGVIKRLKRLKGHALLPGVSDPERGRELVKTSVAAAEAVIATTDAHPGGVAGWVRDHGASEESVRRWRDLILA
ncbi:tyrosine-protein phosphatase [Candidatus Frankia alpina]|uniref:Tyrosine-protein phosphatase n=1 Tax=Candidatus Frankia alpina TaxID=2699483 RepID=A0A4S5EPW2_9ACTN|nr:tyrosine-protein phosphatase [Candidatus Frankia alpina]THJ74133.1 tyrosine-protein phosphatase [Candidatus Frankia alpina]